MRPSVSYGYTPSFEKYYDTYASDASGTFTKQYSRFENGISEHRVETTLTL
jgi:hypothetical protein